MKSLDFFGRHEDREEKTAFVRHRGHFRFNTISALALLIFIALGLGFQGIVADFPDAETIAYITSGVLAAAALLFILPYWPLVIAIIAAIWAVLPVALGVDLQFAAVVLTLGFLISPGFEVINQWDKIVVLRLGRFHKVRGPGVLMLFPLIDSVAGYVDTRIRVTDFSAEKSLTKDTVPVHVDALAFWMIWDPEKAILEVENFEQAVVLSAQTALRASIGSSDLATLLSERERLGEEIRKIVDAKTDSWGITIISVEFKEILIPKELEDVLSRQAQADREKTARIVLGSAEVEIAGAFKKAADQYREDPVAFQLRAMSMIYESIRNRGGMVLVPSSALESMNLGTVLGATAYAKKSPFAAGDLQPENAPGSPPGSAPDSTPDSEPESL
ncbi:MAG: slipin family protein [Spirochaetales bacterium]|nr:slipin family protein [Spirochaetales bacterium]